MKTAPVTLQSLADRLGFSKTTVSVALRGRPGVSEEMRAKIMAEAERLGYKPNPVAAELMAMVRARRHANTGETIAFINTFQKDPGLLKRVIGLRRFYDGVKEQAQQFGYRIEEFRAADYGVTSKRLDQVLKTRGIRGVIVGPRWFAEPEIELDWSAYSCVLLGETTYGAGIYRVCNHHPQSTELALTSLVALGYKRIGLELMTDYESVRHFDFLSGVIPAQRKVGRAARFFVRENESPHAPDVELVPSEKRDAYAREYEKKHVLPKLEKWVQRERLDAFVSLHGYDPAVVCKIKTVGGNPLGYARLDIDPSEGCAGVNEHGEDIGRAAMDLLRELLHSGERGVTPRPRIVLVEGEWVDGPTAPRVKD